MHRFLWLITNNWGLKLTAVALAFLFWAVVKAEAPTRVTIPDIPLTVALRDPEWVLAEAPAPRTVSVVFSGPVRELIRLAVERPSVVVPIPEVDDSTELHYLQASWVQLHSGMDNTSVIDVRPSTARLTFERVITRLVPLAARFSGAVAPGYELSRAVTIEPAVVRVSGPASAVLRIDSLRLPTIDLAARRLTDTVSLAIDTTELRVIVAPRTARVIVPLRPALPDSLISSRGRPGQPPRPFLPTN